MGWCRGDDALDREEVAGTGMSLIQCTGSPTLIRDALADDGVDGLIGDRMGEMVGMSRVW